MPVLKIVFAAVTRASEKWRQFEWTRSDLVEVNVQDDLRDQTRKPDDRRFPSVLRMIGSIRDLHHGSYAAQAATIAVPRHRNSAAVKRT